MKVINFGSLNLDHTYELQEFVRPGETLQTLRHRVCFGGKGLNQSIAAARAGAQVIHVGAVGADGLPILDYLRENGVDTDLIQRLSCDQGQAIIQVNSRGENCIILYPGSNYAITKAWIDYAYARLEPPGYVLFQHETSELTYMIAQAKARGFRTIVNASPFDASMLELRFDEIDWLMVNEVEGRGLTGCEDPEDMVMALREKSPDMGIVLTLGEKGCICLKGDERVDYGIYPVKAVDTTAAGDTFTGYFVAALAEGASLAQAVANATAASAIAVTREGSSTSVPYKEEVEKMIRRSEPVKR